MATKKKATKKTAAKKATITIDSVEIDKLSEKQLSTYLDALHSEKERRKEEKVKPLKAEFKKLYDIAKKKHQLKFTLNLPIDFEFTVQGNVDDPGYYEVL